VAEASVPSAADPLGEVLLADVTRVAITLSRDGQTTFASPGAEGMLGFSPPELLGQSPAFWLSRVHPEDLPGLFEARQRLFSPARAFDVEFRWKRKDDRWIWVRGRVVMRSAGRTADCVLVDVTREKELEEQVRHLQKVEIIGHVTAGIAHDFNNLLSVILANDRFLLDALPEEDPRRADALAIGEAAGRAVTLTRNLLAFSRPQPFARQPLDLNDIIRRAEGLFRRVIGESIELALALDPNPCTVLMDSGQMEQVLMNLVVNARQAMPRGGKLSIDTARVLCAGEPRAPHGSALAGPHVVLKVADTGCGMAAETRRRVFEPFFTTKTDSGGSGLGLATCHSIVAQSGGCMQVDSEPGCGTVFTICLPAGDSSLVATTAGEAAWSGTPRGSETVLVIEDDQRVRALVERILSRLGYRVLLAAAGQDALPLVHAHPGLVDLVLSDVELPDLRGPDVVAHIRDCSPRVKVVFMSGLTREGLVGTGLLAEQVAFIQKPFLPEVLARTVREVLDA
jgi:PAS domain S-box-containing protein